MTDVLPSSEVARGSSPQGPRRPRRVTRRGLFAAAGAGLVAAGASTAAVAVWRDIRAHQGDPLVPPSPTREPSPQQSYWQGDAVIEEHRFRSVHRGPTGYAVLHPPGAAPTSVLPVVIALHGWRDDHRVLLGQRFQLGRFLTEAVAAGVPPFRIVTVDGGTSYYHPHQGEDAGAMVIDELLPRLADTGLATAPSDRIGLLGWSMGGYGALRLGGILGPDRVAALCAVSPALWQDPHLASRAGFSSAREYRRYSVLGRQSDLDGIPVRIDCGTRDRFVQATRSYVDGFTRPIEGGFTPGAHVAWFWRRVLPDQLSYLGRTLSA
ncbi:alpha/beta hydrolase [Nocardioides insulae]|uniref:alpha/beta hydrolase n=1 Tax=Nocardioides insulae TaxID=394734 RepID=UPI0012FB0F70|nr:alpha/beta hydrolase-fold protein [Nocardioides insulae]